MGRVTPHHLTGSVEGTQKSDRKVGRRGILTDGRSRKTQGGLAWSRHRAGPAVKPGAQSPLFYIAQLRSDVLTELQYLTMTTCLFLQSQCILTKFLPFQVYVDGGGKEMCMLLSYFSAVQGSLTQTAF